MLVPTWYKCPWGLKIVICLSKFPCDILELKKVQKKQTKNRLTLTLTATMRKRALLAKMLVWRVGTGNLRRLRLGSKVTDKRKQESQNCSRTNQKKSSLWNNLAGSCRTVCSEWSKPFRTKINSFHLSLWSDRLLNLYGFRKAIVSRAMYESVAQFCSKEIKYVNLQFF